MSTLAETPLHKILLTCLRSEQSGMLVADDGKHKKVLVLEKGKPTGCRSNIKEETLGHLLIKQGLISQAELKPILSEVKETDGFPLGAALLQRGKLEPEKLATMLEEQLILRIMDLFLWKKATIKLKPPKNNLMKDSVPLRKSFPRIILDGMVHRFKNCGGVISKESAGKLTLDMSQVGNMDLQLNPNEMRLFQELASGRTLAEALSIGGLDSEESLALTNALIELDFVKFEETAKPKKPVEEKKQATKESAKPSAKSDGKATDIEKEIIERFKASDNQDYFELLGVPRDCTSAEVRAIFFKLAKDFHPDRLSKLDPDTRQLGEKLFARFTEASNTLTNDAKREEYIQNLDYGSDDATDEAAKILQSETLFQQGRNLIGAGQFRGALAPLLEAVSLYPDEPEYHLYLGYAAYKNAVAEKNTQEMAQSKKLIDKYKDARPNIEVGYTFLAQIAKTEQNLGEARRLFKRALEINPKSTEAERELRLMDMRAEKKGKEKGKGLFGKFK